jgi:hypothetical protein
VANNESEIKAIRFNQNSYVFPDIRTIEGEILDFKLERERLKKDLTRLNEKLSEHSH